MVFCPLYSKQSVKFAPVDVCPKQGNNEQGVACTSGGSRKGARGAPLFLDQTEARRAEKNLFETGPPPPPHLRVWMTGPPLIRRSGSATVHD